jgi:hypothetical protein
VICGLVVDDQRDSVILARNRCAFARMRIEPDQAHDQAGVIGFAATAFAGVQGTRLSCGGRSFQCELNRRIASPHRIGTDQAAGDAGWELDNVAFSGITNTPFAVLVNDTTACRPTKHTRR